MSKTFLSPETQKYLSELIKRNAISRNGLIDQMLINHLCNQKIDEDYFCIKNPINPRNVGI